MSELNAKIGMEIKDVVENPGAAVKSTNRTLLDSLQKTIRLNADSVPRFDKPVADLSFTIPVGLTVDFDLTSCPLARDNDVNYDFTGSRLVGFEVHANENNGGAIKVIPGVTDAYSLWTTELEVLPGESICGCYNVVAANPTTRPLVAAGAKMVRVSGAENDTGEILFVFGTDPPP